MKKILLAALVLASFAGAKAEDPKNMVYLPQFKGETVLGEVEGISADGKYAVIFDDENTISYLWRQDSPYNLTQITAPTLDIKVKVYDINNNGTMVGTFVKPGMEGKETPVICKDGEWKELPFPADAINTNYARLISEDEKHICGIVMMKSRLIQDADGKQAGGYRLIKWTLGDNGEYTYKAYDDMPEEISSNQGFVAVNAMSEDGTVMGGITMIGFSGMMLPVAVVNDNFRWLGNITTRTYRTLIYAPKDMWANEKYYFVDDYCNTSSTEGLAGGFSDYHDGKLYGVRTVVHSTHDIDYDAIQEITADDPGTVLNVGKSLQNCGVIYDVKTGESVEDAAHSAYTMACGDDIFLTGTTVLLDGEQEMNLGEYYGVTLNNSQMIFQKHSDDATVIGGCYPIMNPAIGENQYYPVLVSKYVVNGVDEVLVGPAVSINVADGVIAASEGEVEVYTLNGQLAGKGAKVEVVSGLYIAKAGNVVKKVMVK